MRHPYRRETPTDERGKHPLEEDGSHPPGLGGSHPQRMEGGRGGRGRYADETEIGRQKDTESGRA
jgi:hypothetical protein